MAAKMRNWIALPLASAVGFQPAGRSSPPSVDAEPVDAAGAVDSTRTTFFFFGFSATMPLQGQLLRTAYRVLRTLRRNILTFERRTSSVALSHDDRERDTRPLPAALPRGRALESRRSG